jgi:hypothetical protein
MALLSAANETQSILGYQFNDPRLLLEALRRRLRGVDVAACKVF